MPTLIWLAYASLFTLGLIDNIRGPFFPEILHDLNVNATRGSAFFAVTSLLALFGSMLAHRLERRWTSVQILIIASSLFALGFAAVSAAPTYGSLVPACALFGLGFGLLNVIQNVLVCEAAENDLRRRYLNGLHATYGIAALFAPLIASSVRHLGGSWRQAFFLLATFPLLLSLIAWWVRPQSQRHHAQAPKANFTRAEQVRCAGFALMMAVYLWGELSISTRAVQWLRAARGFSPEAADYLLTGFFLGLLAGRLVFSFHHFKFLSNWRILQVSAGLSGLLYFAALFTTPWLLVAAGLSLSPFFPVTMDQASEAFGRKSTQALSWVIGAGNLSLVFMHFSMGWITDHWGLTYALGFGAGALILVSLGLTAVRRT